MPEPRGLRLRDAAQSSSATVRRRSPFETVVRTSPSRRRRLRLFRSPRVRSRSLCRSAGRSAADRHRHVQYCRRVWPQDLGQADRFDMVRDYTATISTSGSGHLMADRYGTHSCPMRWTGIGQFDQAIRSFMRRQSSGHRAAIHHFALRHKFQRAVTRLRKHQRLGVCR